MGLVELDLNMTDEQKAMRDLVRKLGAEVLRPAAIALDKLADPADVIAKDSVLWDALRQYRKLGLHRGGFPEEFSGLTLDETTGCLISEEMGFAASGLAISFGVSAFPFRFSMLSPDPEVRDWTRQYCEDTEGKIIGMTTERNVRALRAPRSADASSSDPGMRVSPA